MQSLEPEEESVTDTALLTLPYLAISRLFLFLDVSSLVKLSSTCKYFDQLINEEFTLSISIPFSVKQLKEISISGLSRKPVLRLCCKKSRVQESFPENKHDLSYEFSLSEIIEKRNESDGNFPSDYIAFSQMAFLDLHKLRELDLVPFDMESLMEDSDNHIFESYAGLDCTILTILSRQALLGNLTKLCIVVDENFHLAEYMDELTGLLELELTILSGDNMSKESLDGFNRSLQSLVAAIKAPTLKMIVLKELDQRYISRFEILGNRVLATHLKQNKSVEFLEVLGSCRFLMSPDMENLKEIKVKVTTSVCVCPLKKTGFGSKHSPGLCCVMFELSRAWVSSDVKMIFPERPSGNIEMLGENEWRWTRPSGTRALVVEQSNPSIHPPYPLCEVCYREFYENGMGWICNNCFSSL